MKKIYLILLILTFGIYPKISEGQNFAPLGAEWYYGDFWPEVRVSSFIHFWVAKDTIVNGVNCREIQKYNRLYCKDRALKEYIFDRNDSVFVLNPDFDEFQLLYDFNAVPGDSWQFTISSNYVARDTVTVVIDSVSYDTINGKTLKSLYGRRLQRKYFSFAPSQIYSQNIHIMERFGDVYYMFNWMAKNEGTCDFNNSSGLRCYTDSLLGGYHNDTTVPCNYGNISLEEAKSLKRTDVFPNPTSHNIVISTSTLNSISYELINESGQILKTDSFKQSKNLDLRGLPKGLYLLYLMHMDGYSELHKIVKQ
jgi:hypothetical protein